MTNLVADILDVSELADRWRVVKSHHPTAPAYLATEGSPRKYIYVARDLRDVMVSDMTLHNLKSSFPRLAAMAVLPMSLKSYEFWVRQDDLYRTTYDALTSDLAGETARVAGFLGADLQPDQVAAIAESHASEKVAQEVASHYSDRPVSSATDIDSRIGFRKGHFQGGETGKWMRSLSPLQVAFIEFHARSWLVDNGFTLSQPRLLRLAAGLLGAPFRIAGRIVTKAKLATGADVY